MASRVFLLSAATVLFAFAACSDDSSPADATVDALSDAAPKDITLPDSADIGPDPDTTVDAGTPVPSCTVVAPKQAATLTDADDKDNTNSTFDYDVVIKVDNADGATLGLWYGAQEPPDGNEQKTAAVSGDAATVTFADAILPEGTYLVSGYFSVGGKNYSCSAEVTVQSAFATCAIASYTPALSTTCGKHTLQDGDENTADLQTTVTVNTDADVTEVTLNVGAQAFTATPTAGVATFDLTLTEGTHTLQPACTNATKTSNGLSSTLIADFTAPAAVSDLACTITNNRTGALQCTFTEPSDGSGAGVASYELHYLANAEIAGVNFDAANVVSPAPTVTAAGQTKTVTGLTGTILNTYHYALRSRDCAGNASDVSPETLAKVAFHETPYVGTTDNDQLGISMESGDFNCDGFRDVAVGVAKVAFGAKATAGAVHLYFGTGTGLSATPNVVIQGTEAKASFGFRLAALDFNGDGSCTDLAVQASAGHGTVDEIGPGRVFLYLGHATWAATRTDIDTGTGAEIIWQVPATALADEQLGVGLAALDLDGDGTDDLAMTHWLKTGADWSQVLVDYGETGLTPLGAGDSPAIREMPTAADLLLTGGTQDNAFGSPISSAGRLTVDGTGTPDAFDDLLIGAKGKSSDSAYPGAAYILQGQARAVSQETVTINDARVHTINGVLASGNLQFGSLVAGVGDMDGDGVAEFAVSDVRKTNTAGQTKAGEIYIFDLKTGVPTSTADAKAVILNDVTDAASDRLGNTLANGSRLDPIKGADLNNDGFADFAFATYQSGSMALPTLYIVSGAATLPATIAVSSLTQKVVPDDDVVAKSYAKAITFIGDVDGDSYTDMCVGDISHNVDRGRALVYH